LSVRWPGRHEPFLGDVENGLRQIHDFGVVGQRERSNLAFPVTYSAVVIDDGRNVFAEGGFGHR
ncbi:hypothetical protein OAE98_03625, partial [Akkermansiaceae bacterium]|nr:hypothetical protein [Akkermansiaceae bacterium]